MNITPGQARALLRLRGGEELPRSSIAPALRNLLLAKGACRLISSGSARGRLAANLPTFDRVIRDVLRITDLPTLANLPTQRSRTAVAAATAHSKTFRASPLTGGWLLRAVGQAEIRVGDTRHGPHPVGASLYVQAQVLEQVELRCEYWVGVENAETFLRAECLFACTPTNAVFMLRWGWGEYWRGWLGTFAGQVAYLGDYDPKGVAIFADELLPARPDARFLSPPDLPDQLKRGDYGRFHQQESVLPRLTRSSNSQVRTLAKAITQARKGLDQEALSDGVLGVLTTTP
jgi:hypothetical protein